MTIEIFPTTAGVELGHPCLPQALGQMPVTPAWEETQPNSSPGNQSHELAVALGEGHTDAAADVLDAFKDVCRGAAGCKGCPLLGDA